MKKILFLLDNGLDILGGSPKSTSTICNILLKNGFDVKIWCPEYDKNLTLFSDQNVFKYKKKNNKLNYLFYRLRNLRKCINDYNPGIVHAQDAQCAILVAFLKKYKFIKRTIKIYYTDRKLFSAYKNNSRKIFVRYQKYFDKIICTTNTNLLNWKKYTKIEDIKCINNVLDSDWYDFDELYKEQVKKSLGIEGKFVISFCARFEEYKRWDTVFDICKLLSKDEKFMFNIALVTLNINETNFVNYVSSLKDLLGDRLILKINIRDITEMKNFYYKSDFFIMTSENESFGRTILEAMSKKCIVLGTNSGGVPDVLKKEDYLFDVNDSYKVKNLIYDIIDNGRYLTVVNDQYKIFNDNYSLDAFSKKTIDIY